VARLLRVTAAAEIPVGRARTIEVDGARVAIFNAGDGRYHALGATCPHEEGPLGDGIVVRGAAVCPWHGFDFDLRTGACGIDPELAAPVYPVRRDGADLLVELP
jgi:nitrite reductase (NADH) small subunit